MFGKKSMEKDVVCGMSVDTKTALKVERGGRTYYFCSNDCKTQFEADPEKFTGGMSGMSNHSHDGSHGGCC